MTDPDAFVCFMRSDPGATGGHRVVAFRWYGLRIGLSEAVADRSGGADVILVVGEDAPLSCETGDLILRGARFH